MVSSRPSIAHKMQTDTVGRLERLQKLSLERQEEEVVSAVKDGGEMDGSTAFDIEGRARVGDKRSAVRLRFPPLSLSLSAKALEPGFPASGAARRKAGGSLRCCDRIVWSRRCGC